MKARSVSHLRLGSVLAGICGLLVLAGCASMEAPRQESLLQTAGFQKRTPITAQQKAAYAKLPAYELHQGTLKGRTIYAYKDEKAGVVYLGSQAEYAQYKQLAAKAKLKEEQMTAARIELDEKEAKLYSQWYDGRIL